MFHCKMSSAEERRLLEGGNAAIDEDHIHKGLYATIWETLWEEGLRDYTAQEGNVAARAYCAKLRSQAGRKRARAQKKARVRKKKSSR
jgi:hypothetical protein